jgi:hypothetical protein
MSAWEPVMSAAAALNVSPNAAAMINSRFFAFVICMIAPG